MTEGGQGRGEKACGRLADLNESDW